MLTMIRFDRLLVCVLCIAIGMSLAFYRASVGTVAHASAKTTKVKYSPTIQKAPGSEPVDIVSYFKSDEGKDVLHEIAMIMKDQEPTPAPTPAPAAEVTKIETPRMENEKAKVNSMIASTYGAVSSTKASGGSSGSLMKKASTQSTGFNTVYSTKSSNGSSGHTQYKQTKTASAYTPTQHWTYPGDIASHMASDHGKDINGMSEEELLNWHDSIHYEERAAIASSMSPPRTQNVSYSTSDCPGGVCPTKGSVQYNNAGVRQGLLARLFSR